MIDCLECGASGRLIVTLSPRGWEAPGGGWELDEDEEVCPGCHGTGSATTWEGAANEEG